MQILADGALTRDAKLFMKIFNEMLTPILRMQKAI